MVMTKRNTSEISKSLQNKFLYDSDLNSIHILLNLYEIEENIGKIYPRYTSMSELKKSIFRFMHSRVGAELSSKNLSELVHEDLNRLELYIYLEGYKMGYRALKPANTLEKLTLNHIDISKLYRMNYLFQYSCEYEDVKKYKNQLYMYIQRDIRNTELFKTTIYKYCNAVLKLKVFCLNGYLDNQLTLDYDENGPTFIYESEPFTKRELSVLYKKLTRMIYTESMKLYKNAFWDGLNDRVLNRYR